MWTSYSLQILTRFNWKVSIESMSSSSEDSLQNFKKDSEPHPPVQTNTVATFPNELLLQFFTIATIVDVLADFDFRDVLYLIHVCARWRAIALEYPILWSQLSSTMPGDIARWFLQHSQQALLQVYVGRDFTNDSINEDTSRGVCHTILDGVLRQASRVETLYLHRPRKGRLFFPDSILDPASHFTHLRSITLRSLEDPGICQILTNYSDLPFIARAPSLSHLVLWTTLIRPPKIDTNLGNVDASILSNVKHLEIGGDSVGYSIQLIYLHAIGLGKISNLVCLELSFGDQPDDSADWLSTDALGSFPRLKVLSINAPPSICIYFLTTIITPPTTRLRIVCARPREEARPRLGQLMKLICSRLDDCHRFRSLVLDGSRAYDYQISGWIEAGRGLFGHHAPAADSPHLDFKLPWQKGPRRPDAYAERELASCMEAVRDSSFGHVETLTIRVLKITRTDWPSFLRLAVGVRVLKIWSNGLLSKLVNNLSVKGSEVLLPALRSLQIAEGTETILSGGKAEATAAILLRCVKTRKDAGVPVGELVFERLSSELREEIMSSPLVDAAKLTWL